MLFCFCLVRVLSGVVFAVLRCLLCCDVLCRVVSCCVVLCCVVSCCVALFCVVLCCVVLCCVVLSCMLVCRVVLCCVALCCVVLCCVVPIRLTTLLFFPLCFCVSYRVVLCCVAAFVFFLPWMDGWMGGYGAGANCVVLEKCTEATRAKLKVLDTDPAYKVRQRACPSIATLQGRLYFFIFRWCFFCFFLLSDAPAVTRWRRSSVLVPLVLLWECFIRVMPRELHDSVGFLSLLPLDLLLFFW